MNEYLVHPRVGIDRSRYIQRWRSAFDGTRFHPPTDVYETESDIVVTVEVAGLEEGAYEISLSEKDRVLTVSGRRTLPNNDSRLTYHQLEIQQGEFISQVLIPHALSDPEQATADYQDGFLVISLPKAKPRHVPVRELK